MKELTDEQWEKIKDLLPGKKTDPGRTAVDNRKFIEAIVWIARNGASWRSLPEKYGKWATNYKRFIRWVRAGVWQRIFEKLAADGDTELLMIDSTVVRAHQHAAGAQKKEQQR